jgi:hypothetical protein
MKDEGKSRLSRLSKYSPLFSSGSRGRSPHQKTLTEV